MTGLRVTANRATTWLKNHALPLWADAGFSPETGVFREALDFDGRPRLDVPLRSRVQGRQMYVYGQAAELGWFDGAHLVRQAFDAGYPRFEHPEGGYVFTLHPDGSVRDATRFLYEQAFALLGFSWHYRVNRDPEACSRAERLWVWLGHHLKDPHSLGYAMSVPPTGPRSQNPHMHLFEACLNWFEASRDEVWLARADELFGLFGRHFYDPEHEVVREFFADDWTLRGPEVHRIDPGHQVEWVWLLGWYGRLSGKSVMGPTPALYAAALRLGRNARTNLICEEADLAGNPLKSSARLWSQTELLKAQVALYEHQPSASLSTAICATVDLIFGVHLATRRQGLWQDKVDVAGRGQAHDVPGSTLYHVFLAFAEIDRLVRRSHAL